jgi:hypothetical protein
MKPLSCLFAIVFFCLFLGVQQTQAQYCSYGVVYGTSFAWQSGDAVYGYSATELDYCAGAYYDPAVWGRFSEGNWATENPTMLAEGYTEGYADWIPAEIYFSYQYPVNNEYYNVDSTHYVLEYYQVYYCYWGCGYNWYDPWGWGFAEGGYYGGPTYYGYGGAGYWQTRRRTVGRTFHTIVYQGSSQCPIGQPFTPTGKTCTEEPPDPTDPSAISVKIKDKSGNNITNTEQVAMLGVPVKLSAQSNYASATFSWTTNGEASATTGNTIRVSWADTGTYTVTLTASVKGIPKSVQTKIKVQAPTLEKIEATQNIPIYDRDGSCAGYKALALGCSSLSSEVKGGIEITASVSAPTGDISNSEEAKIKFVQIGTTYRAKIVSGDKFCSTNRTSQTDTSTGWHIDADYGNESGKVRGIPVVGNFSTGKAVARINDSPFNQLTYQTEQFIDDVFETYVVYYVTTVKGNLVERVIGKLAWSWQGKAVNIKDTNDYQLDTSFSKPAQAQTLTGVAITEVKNKVSDIRPYNNSVNIKDIPYQYCGPPKPLPQLDSAFVSQQVPTTVEASQEFSVSITMRNTGTATWTMGDFYLISISPLSGFRPSNVALPSNVAPGQTVTFAFEVLAPSTSGRRTFQWRMADTTTGSTVEFGDLTPPVYIQVTSLQGSCGSMYKYDPYCEPVWY